MMAPPEEFICDICGALIESPKHGYLVFEGDENLKRKNFKIVHNQDRCLTELPMSFSLDRITSRDGLGIMMSWIHIGKLEPKNTSEFLSNKEFAELFKRLHLPYYEEARLFFNQAHNDGFLDGNYVSWHSPSNLKRIIERYSEDVL